MTAVVKKWISENTGEAEFRELVRWMFDYLKENKKSRTICMPLKFLLPCAIIFID